MVARTEICEEMLRKYFGRAGLPLEISPSPFGGLMNGEIFQLGIAGSGRGERVRVYLGDGKTRLQVLDVDPALRQLLLHVDEPERTFVTRRWEFRPKREIREVRRTPGGVRKFLIGHDESHLFVARLPKPAESVRRAHEILRPDELERSGKIRRQGEWFFLPASPEVIREIEARPILITRKGDISAGRGRAHTADELIRLYGKTYVRGRVRHSQHRTRKFPAWVRVVRNTEVSTDGIFGWVD